MNNNDIEEDIKKLERVIKLAKQTGLDKTLALAIENVVEEYKRYKNMYEAEHRIHLVRNEQLERKEIAVQKANKYDRLVDRIKENLDKRKQKYNEILNDYGNIDTDVIFNIPNANVRKRLDELSFEIVILQELIEEE